MKRITAVILSACMFGLALPVGAAVNFTEISGAVEFPLDGGQNVAGTYYKVTGATTLKLSGVATDGAGTINAGFWIPNEDVTLTVDASGVEGLVHLVLRDSLRGDGTFCAGSGITKVSFGGSYNRDNVLHLKALEAKLAMTEAAGTVELVDGISLMRWPVATYSVAEGAVIAPFAEGLFDPEELTLGTFDLHVAYPNAVGTGCKITINEGRVLYHRSCNMYAPDEKTPTSLSQWYGAADTTRTFDVILNGGQFELQDRTANTCVKGSITGQGKVLHFGTSEVILDGVFDFEGELRCFIVGTSEGQSALRLRAAEGSDFSETDVVLTGNSTIRPSKVTFETAAAPLSVRSLTCLQKSGLNHVSIGTDVSVSFGTVSGPVSLVGGGGFMTVMAADATAEVDLKAGGNSVWSVKSQCGEPLRIASVEDGVTGGELTLDGSVQVEDATGLSKLTVLSGANVIYAAPNDLPEIDNRGGTFSIDQDVIWQRQAALWLDASASDTLSNALLQAKAIYTGSGTPSVADNAVYEWLDCRPSQRTYRIRSTRYDKPAASIAGGVFPKLESDEGGVYLSWWDVNRTRASMAGSTYNGNSSSLSAKCIISVFGSQLGGGCAMFCESSARLARVDSSVYSATIKQDTVPYSTPICLDATVGVRTNGVAVAGNETGLSGGWQIVTLSSETAFSLTGIGHPKMPDGGSGNGLQNYREIVVFKEMPSDETIRTVERYLAKKWNLPYAVPAAPRAVPVSGSGTVRLDCDATHVAQGYFAGTLDLNGNKYAIGAGKLPIAAADVPAANRILWVDPALEGAVVLVDDVSRPDKVKMIYTRDNAGLLMGKGNYYMTSPYGESETWDSFKADRRVRWTDGWLDFLNGYGEWGGNMLAIKKLPYTADMTAYNDGGETLSAVRGGFFALDSSRGGGSPMLSAVNGGVSDSNVIGARGATSPIWVLGKGSTIAFDTWLDGQSVDGLTQGFSGAKEVMSFGVKDGGSFRHKTTGYCAPSEKFVNNMEIIGEYILYSQPLETADRENVEAYLMKKWLGKNRVGYTEPRDMTVTGAGTLAVATGDFLPKLSVGFSGTVEVTGAVWSFTLVQGAVKAKDAWECPDVTVTAPATVSVDLDVSAARQGKFLLASAGTFAEGTVFTLGTLVNPRERIVTLVREGNALYATVEPKGLVLIVK